MVEVFKTNVERQQESEILAQILLAHYPAARITFDLEDHDRVLRVEEHDLCAEKIMGLVTKYGYQCEVLPE